MDDSLLDMLIANVRNLLRGKPEELPTPTIPPTTIVATDTGESEDMRIGTANIKYNLPLPKIAQDGAAMGRHCDIWGGQEIEAAGQAYETIMNALGDKWQGVHGNTRLPIFLRADKLDVVDTLRRNYPLSRPIKYTPHDRIHTAVIVKSKTRTTLPPFALINNHLIAGAYNAATPTAPDVPARRRQYDLEWANLNRFISELRGKGLTTFIVGDFNRPTVPKPQIDFKWLAGSRLDRVGVTTGGNIRVEQRDTMPVILNSDHTGQIARVRLMKRK